jgi:hypothetical protein
VRHPTEQADLAALIEEGIARVTHMASLDVLIPERRRFGLITEVGSLETGSFEDWPAPAQFNSIHDALREWAVQKPCILEAFGAEVLKISKGVSEGWLEDTGDCTYARAVVLVEPADPEGNPAILHGFDVYWDFSFSWPEGLEVRSMSCLEESWEDIFG